MIRTANFPFAPPPKMKVSSLFYWNQTFVGCSPAAVRGHFGGVFFFLVFDLRTIFAASLLAAAENNVLSDVSEAGQMSYHKTAEKRANFKTCVSVATYVGGREALERCRGWGGGGGWFQTVTLAARIS